MMSAAYDWDRQQAHQQHQQSFMAAIETPPEPKGGKRSRQTYSKYQTAVLETVFQTSKYIVRNKRQQMSVELNLTERQIKIWFQNRRMKEKKCNKDVPRIDRHCLTTTMAGYQHAEDYAAVDQVASGYQMSSVSSNNNLQDSTFTDYHRPGSKPMHQDANGYGGYGRGGGYDLLTPEPDPYDDVIAKQQWPPISVDFHQDFFGDHDLGNFQRLQTTHLHRGPLNSQVPDYCSPPQLLQAAHGY